MGDTDIGWTHRPGTRGRSWNPTQGCRRISPGCEHCYAERMAARFAESGWSKGLINLRTGKWNGAARLVPHKLAEPLSWRDPSTVFVNSMSDLFYEGFSFEEIAAVFGVMAACGEHTFQALTKRAHRMREWFEWVEAKRLPLEYCLNEARRALEDASVCSLRGHGRLAGVGVAWPLPNVWLGTSVEHQDEMARVVELLRTPAAIRFVSAEPLLGPLDFLAASPNARSLLEDLDWLIAGCESGPGSRACSVEWLQSLRDQCAAARVRFFLKQAKQKGSEAVGGPLITIGKRSEAGAGGVIQLPYLDGQVHAEFPA